MPPISPAITTIESANRIVWLTERSSIRRASGSCTFQSTCQRVEPSAVGGLDRVRRHAADAERGDPDRRRDRVDHRRDDRRARADREEDHDRHQVRERRDDLHRVEHRRDRALEAVASGLRARRAASRSASESATAANISAKVCDALVPEAHAAAKRRERRERRRAPRARPPKRSTTSGAEHRRPDPRQLVEEAASASETRLSRNVAKPLKMRKKMFGFGTLRWSMSHVWKWSR